MASHVEPDFQTVTLSRAISALQKLGNLGDELSKRPKSSPPKSRWRSVSNWLFVAAGTLFAVLALLTIAKKTTSLPSPEPSIALALGAGCEVFVLLGFIFQIASEVAAIRAIRRAGTSNWLAECRRELDAVSSLSNFSAASLALADKLLEHSIKRTDQKLLIFFGNNLALPAVVGLLALGKDVLGLPAFPLVLAGTLLVLLLAAFFLAGIAQRLSLEKLARQRHLVALVPLLSAVDNGGEEGHGCRDHPETSAEQKLAATLVEISRAPWQDLRYNRRC